MIIGCDVSEYQPTWTPASDEDFVIIKATLGRTIYDPLTAQHAATARKAGLVVGFYHFLWPSHDSGTGAQQADWFLDHIPDLRPGELLVCDWESNNAGLPSEADVTSFLDRLASLHPEHRRGLYATPSRHREYARDDTFPWLAHWTSADHPGDEGQPWVLWQYTDTPYDHDRGDFDSREEMRRWAEGAEPDSGWPFGLTTLKKFDRSTDQTIYPEVAV